MRFALILMSVAVLAACASNRLEPVPETGAFSIQYLEIDGDFFVKVEKVGVSQAVTLLDSAHPNRSQWKRRDWEEYAAVLFPQDEIDFNALRDLRGSNLVPRGLVSPTASAVPPCEETKDPEFAKIQKRVIRRAADDGMRGEITMETTCFLHEGLSPSQYSGIHERPNPFRFPTRYETVVDLDRDNAAEQRNVRIRNVSKARIMEFIRSETILPKKVRRQLGDAIDRL